MLLNSTKRRSIFRAGSHTVGVSIHYSYINQVLKVLIAMSVLHLHLHILIGCALDGVASVEHGQHLGRHNLELLLVLEIYHLAYSKVYFIVENPLVANTFSRLCFHVWNGFICVWKA